MPHVRQYHGHSVFIGGLYDLFVFDRTARLDDRSDADFGQDIDPVPEREKAVGCRDGTFERFAGVEGAYLCRLDSACLTDADAERAVPECIDYGVGPHMLADLP